MCAVRDLTEAQFRSTSKMASSGPSCLEQSSVCHQLSASVTCMLPRVISLVTTACKVGSLASRCWRSSQAVLGSTYVNSVASTAAALTKAETEAAANDTATAEDNGFNNMHWYTTSMTAISFIAVAISQLCLMWDTCCSQKHSSSHHGKAHNSDCSGSSSSSGTALRQGR